MTLYVGTSGYQYTEWRGHFYPEDLATAGMLAYYASRLPSVEINNTFYRLPRPSVLEKWAADVPDDFRFVIKASRRITHMSRLAESCRDALAYLYETLEVLGPKRGPILFQLPPFLRADLERLQAFLEWLPPAPRAAFEFRHDSWNTAEVHRTLSEKGCAWCSADVGDEEPAIISTADFGYLRLRRQDYTDADLATWASLVRESGWDDAYVFFKHEDEGAGPALAERFRELLAG